MTMIYRSEARKVYEELASHHDGKLGYVIYRVAYGNDENWALFIERITAWVKKWLLEEEDPELVAGLFAWDVRNDEEQFKDATKVDIAKYHKAWSESVGGRSWITKYAYCIYADAEVIESVVSGPDPSDDDVRCDARWGMFVKVLDNMLPELPWQYTASEVPDDERREAINTTHDEGCPPVEGARYYAVGWMKIAVTSLFPRAYALLMDEGWDKYYARPPTIQHS